MIVWKVTGRNQPRRPRVARTTFTGLLAHTDKEYWIQERYFSINLIQENIFKNVKKGGSLRINIDHKVGIFQEKHLYVRRISAFSTF